MNMKRYIGIAIRALVALVGLGYVATTLTWMDTIVLPAGFELNGTVVTDSQGSFQIVHETESALTLKIDADRTVAIPRGLLRKDRLPPRFEPGLLTTVSRAHLGWLLAALLVVAPVYLFQASRWGLLMHCRGLPTPPWRTFRLLMVGCFFNSFMPGTTGGDVMKAIYVARGAEQKTAAVISVIVDRVIGLVALLLLGVVAGSFMFNDGRARDTIIVMWVLAGLAAAASIVYFSGRIRRSLGISWLITRFHEDNLVRRIDEATVAYRRHPYALFMALVLAVPVHVLTIVSAAFTGWAIGMGTELSVLLAVLPLVILAGSIPVSFMGFGVMEPIAIQLLEGETATVNQIVTMIVLFRVYLILYSMIGAIFLMRGRLHLQPIDADIPDDPPDTAEADPAPA